MRWLFLVATFLGLSNVDLATAANETTPQLVVMQCLPDEEAEAYLEKLSETHSEYALGWITPPGELQFVSRSQN